LTKVAGVEELAHAGDKIHRISAEIQDRLAFFPDYSLEKKPEKEGSGSASVSKVGTTIAGIIGAVLVFIVAGILGILLRKKGKTGNADGKPGDKS
jgi:hypothetical protein